LLEFIFIKELGVLNDGYETQSAEISLEEEYQQEGEKVKGQSANARKDVDVDVTKTEQICREQWDSPVEFLLSCIAMSVGLGNVWRFPFTAYENGGGAFLLPYLIVLLVIGRPIYFLEMTIGQFSQVGPVGVWALAPFFKGKLSILDSTHNCWMCAYLKY
jgi:hypothetical protein